MRQETRKHCGMAVSKSSQNISNAWRAVVMADDIQESRRMGGFRDIRYRQWSGRVDERCRNAAGLFGGGFALTDFDQTDLIRQGGWFLQSRPPLTQLVKTDCRQR